MTRKAPNREIGATVLLSILGLALATPSWALDDKPVELVQARSEVPEELLLDIGIQLFDPGLPDDEYERYMLEEKGIFSDVRNAEARYLPMRLKQTLEMSGYWGAVRIVPVSHVIDLRIGGTIYKSNGKDLEIDLIAVDARGKKWLDKRYKGEANPIVYKETETDREPFQSLYNKIANDLLKVAKKLDAEDVQEVRRVAELRFAKYLAPIAFGDYLEVKKSKYKIEKLPSYEDPMMLRLADIRERDFMFVDTLNEYYADFHAQIDPAYDSWRSYAYEEQLAYDKLTKQGRLEKILGAAAIVGGVVAATRGGRAGQGVGQVGIMGGMAVLQNGFQKSEEAKMHREALRELAASFDSEVAPILIDVDGEVLRLTGSVGTQYDTWRQILRQIFAAETGLPLDPNAAPIPASGGPPKN